jgi:hypothetical protein
MRLSRRLPVISSTLRAPAGFAGVNLFMAENSLLGRLLPRVSAPDQCDTIVPSTRQGRAGRYSGDAGLQMVGSENRSGAYFSYVSTGSAGSRHLQTGIT